MSGLSQQQELTQLKKRARRRLVGAIVLVAVSTAVLWNVLGAIPDQKMKPEAVEIVGLESSQPATTAVAASAPLSASVEASAAASDTELTASLADADPMPPPLAPAASSVPPSASAVATPPAAITSSPVKPAPAMPSQPVSTPKPAKREPVEKAPVRERDPLAILEGRETAHAEPKPVQPKAASVTRYMVQLAALSDPDKVAALKARLAANGLSASFSQVQTSKGEVVRVRMGPFASRAEADAALSRLARAGVNGIVVTLK